jgi:hypothetical protein
MPGLSTGPIVLFIVIACGVVFLLWVLYHFILESRPRRGQRHSEWPEPDRNRNGKKTFLIACAIACLYLQSAAAHPPSAGARNGRGVDQRDCQHKQEQNRHC